MKKVQHRAKCLNFPSAIALATKTEDLKHARVRVRAHRAETAEPGLNKRRRHEGCHNPSLSPSALHVDQVTIFSCLAPGRFNTPKDPALAEALTPRSQAASSRQQDDGGGLVR